MVSLLLLASNFTASQGVLGSWDVGTYVTFTEYNTNRVLARDNVENVESTAITESLMVLDVNITSVNNVTGVVYFDLIDLGGTINPLSDDYFMSDLTADYATINDLFNFNYRYDQGVNQTVLFGFGINLADYLFIEANWTIFNDHFDSILNSSTIVDTVNDPYSSTVYNITFGDFLASCNSYSINGQSSLSAAKQTLTSSNTELSLTFDNGGVRHWRTWNGTAGYYNYFAYDEFTIENNLRFNSGGIMQEFLYRSLIGSTSGDVYSETESLLGIYYGVYEPPTDDSSIGYLLVIPTIATLVVLIKWSRKRKN